MPVDHGGIAVPVGAFRGLAGTVPGDPDVVVGVLLVVAAQGLLPGRGRWRVADRTGRAQATARRVPAQRAGDCFAGSDFSHFLGGFEAGGPGHGWSVAWGYDWPQTAQVGIVLFPPTSWGDRACADRSSSAARCRDRTSRKLNKQPLWPPYEMNRQSSRRRAYKTADSLGTGRIDDRSVVSSRTGLLRRRVARCRA